MTKTITAPVVKIVEVTMAEYLAMERDPATQYMITDAPIRELPEYPTAQGMYALVVDVASDMPKVVWVSTSGVYAYKGTVATYEDLPKSGMRNGDVYNVNDTGKNYAWDGTKWDDLGGTIDLSEYATNQSVKEAIAAERSISDNKYLSVADSEAFALKSALEETNKMVEQHTHEISDVMGDISALEADKQDKLTAGENITIDEDGTISATGSSLPEISSDTESRYLTNENGEVKWSSKLRITPYVVALGANTQTKQNYLVAIGAEAQATNYYAIAIGTAVQATARHSIQMGYNGINSEEYAFCIAFGAGKNYKLFDGDAGLIPSARFANEGEDGQVLVKNGDYAEWKTVEGGGEGSGLPEISEVNSNGILTNDGANPTWSPVRIWNNDLYGTRSTLTITLPTNDNGADTNYTNIGGDSVCVGRPSYGDFSGTSGVVFIGTGAGQRRWNSASFSVAVGYNAQVDGPGSIMIGSGENNDPGTFCVGLGDSGNHNVYKVLDADGHIPDERLPQLGDILSALTAILGDA